MAAVAAQGLTGEGALHVPFWLLEAGEGLQASASSWLLIVLPSSLSSVHYHVSVSLGKLLTQKLMGVSKQEGRGTGKPDYWLVDTDLQSDITPCLPCSVDQHYLQVQPTLKEGDHTRPECGNGGEFGPLGGFLPRISCDSSLFFSVFSLLCLPAFFQPLSLSLPLYLAPYLHFAHAHCCPLACLLLLGVPSLCLCHSVHAVPLWQPLYLCWPVPSFPFRPVCHPCLLPLAGNCTTSTLLISLYCSVPRVYLITLQFLF